MRSRIRKKFARQVEDTAQTVRARDRVENEFGAGHPLTTAFADLCARMKACEEAILRPAPGLAR
jgi:hypothetical protein